MDLEALDTTAPVQWEKALATLPEDRRDVYFTPEYASLYERPGTRARCLSLRDGGETFVHVFLERRVSAVGGCPLDTECWIAESLYGYGGPLSSTDDPDFLAAAHETLEARQREAGIVSEFIRFHPLLENHRWAPRGWQPVVDRRTVAMDLARGEANVWESDYPSTHRNRIRRARAAGVGIELSTSADDHAAFVEIYAATMRRVGARPFVHFSRAYFDALRARLGPAWLLFVARWRGRVAAGAIVLAQGRRLHHHLSGSSAEAQPVGPNNLLFHEIAGWGRARGFRWFHLGGGATSAEDDQLLRFKKNFSPIRPAFYTGRAVYDGSRHEGLRARWLAANPERAAGAYFQVYASEGETAP